MAILIGTEGNDSLAGTLEADSLSGLAGQDTLGGGGGADTVRGGDGADTIFDDAANGAGDMLFGEAGDDVLDVSFNVRLPTAVLLDGGDGDDRISVFSAFADLRGLVVAGGAGHDTLAFSSGAVVVLDTLARISGIEVLSSPGIDVVGTEAADLLDFGRFALPVASLRVFGGEGGDTLHGTRVFGESGDDSLLGLGPGGSYLSGGSGRDTLAGLGSDTMLGGSGDDLYLVDQSGDLVVEDPGGGRDTVRASISHTLPAGVEALVLSGNADLDGTGNAGANSLDGNDGANRLDGGRGNDRMFGGAHRDTLLGGRGDDSLDGGTGDDRLVGGKGGDRLTGGDGRDRFAYAAPSDGGDVILDFTPMIDVIQLSKAGFGLSSVAGLGISAVDWGVFASAAAFDLSGVKVGFIGPDSDLYVDTNGAITGGLVLVAHVPGSGPTTAADYLIVA